MTQISSSLFFPPRASQTVHSNYTVGVCTCQRVWCNKPKQVDKERWNCREIKRVCLLSLSVLFPSCSKHSVHWASWVYQVCRGWLMMWCFGSQRQFIPKVASLLPCEFYSWQDETSSGWTLRTIFTLCTKILESVLVSFSKFWEGVCTYACQKSKTTTLTRVKISWVEL